MSENNDILRQIKAMGDDFRAETPKLFKKKNEVRAELAEMGILKRDGKNTYSNYTYFSEAQYKELFTNLFSKHKLEMCATTKSVELFDVAGQKPQHGAKVAVEFILQDVETGYFEKSVFYGVSHDTGDKAVFQAYTGALKYYFATTWAVATGDEVESDAMEKKKSTQTEPTKPSQKQIDLIRALAKEQGLDDSQIDEKLAKISTAKLASATISKMKGKS